eukprot:CAMPEP_0184481998 /NCGR_PEP_ID=MMETSP0113_2-20130426/3582_1 /TAXON_ID=91329 /ORGANISM="Norrisiella sphaerica, Strain BC52" /LENGTH=443 /DNA_ID=CAMNT_0026861499 /DNA_START=633 /DNA_END=1967 /DNA_ORIENTATION=-
MDPVSAIIINKKHLLPPGAVTHLTLVFYFEDCPDLDKVKQDAKPLLEYKRFCSVPVPNPDAIFESAWKRVEVNYDKHFAEKKVDGDVDLKQQLSKLALKPMSNEEDFPLWRIDLLRNTKQGCRSAVVWRLDHSIGDGIGLLPVGYKFSRTIDGKPGEPKQFLPKRRGSSSKGGASNLTRLINSALKDLNTVATLANGPFDNCDTININRTRKTLAHNGKRIILDFDFKLDDIQSIRKATGYTINDIVVALFAGAVRRYMEKMGDRALDNPEKIKMTGLAPFAQPRGTRPGQVQNKMVFIHFSFPVGPSTMKERLEKAHQEFDHLKRSIQVPLLNFITDVGTKLGLENALAQENTKIWHRSSWVFSNVPGPRERMIVFGKEMTSFKPFYNNVLHQAIFFSYAGEMSLGLVLDTESIKKPELLVRCFEEELRVAKEAASGEKKQN